MRILLIAVLLTGLANMAATIESGAQVTPYDERALRVDAAPGLRIVRGVSDSVVLNIGEFRRTGLADLVATSPTPSSRPRFLRRIIDPVRGSSAPASRCWDSTWV